MYSCEILHIGFEIVNDELRFRMYLSGLI